MPKYPNPTQPTLESTAGGVTIHSQITASSHVPGPVDSATTSTVGNHQDAGASVASPVSANPATQAGAGHSQASTDSMPARPPPINPPALPAAVGDSASDSALPAAEAGNLQPATSPSPTKSTFRAIASAIDLAQPAAQSVAPALLALDGAQPTLTATPNAPTTAATAAASPAHPTTPTEQVAPVLLSMAKASDGSQQMTVQLRPMDLGMVQVRIDRAQSGATRVEITAENPGTLLAIQRDQPQLHHALDQAGISAAGRTLTFHVAQPSTTPTPGSHSGGQSGSASRGSAGSTDSDASAGGGRGSYGARERSRYSFARQSTADTAPAITTSASTGSYRVGLDITA